MGDGRSGTVRRGLQVLTALVLGVALVGFVAGLRPQARPDEGLPRVPDGGSKMEAMPTTPYWALRDRKAGLSRTVTSDLGVLRAALPSPADPVIQAPGDRAKTVEARALRRAFNGAPPMVPHPVDEQSSTTCLACHGAGMRVADRNAPVMSHEPRSQCLQCHVGMEANRPGAETPVVPTTFVGLASAGPGARAWEGAPPTIPHGIWMREDCASCHGVAGLTGLRTTHPARKNCTQCHVPAESPQPFARGK